VVLLDGDAHARFPPVTNLTNTGVTLAVLGSSLAAAMAIHYEQLDGHVARITIDRPEARNSLDLHHFRDLAEAWRRFRDDPEAWVAIVTGVDGNFMTGADLKTYIPQITALQQQISAGEVDEIDGCRLRDGTDAVLRSLKIYKPIIAAVDGPCVAGGMEMLGGVDIRLATERATFGVMEPKRGLFAGGGTTVRLPRQVSFPAAMELLLTAEAFPASRAMELGLLNEIVPQAELADRALAWAARITVNAPLAVQATKESVLRGLAVDQREAYRIEGELAGKIFSSEDAKEGPKAFAEKREPKWTGT
jgi:enoyl-CoA hydratase